MRPDSEEEMAPADIRCDGAMSELGPISDPGARPSQVRSSPDSGHRKTGAADPFRANRNYGASALCLQRFCSCFLLHNSHGNSFRLKSRLRRLARKRNLAIWPRQNNATGKSVKTLSSPLEKNIPLPPSGKSVVSLHPSHPTRGAARDRHERAVGCGGRALCF